jgi:hypothetical protein
MELLYGGRLWSAGRTGKHAPRRGNPSANLAKQNASRPASPLLWCPGASDRGRTGTLAAVGDLERTVEISQQTCRSRWRPWCRGSVVSRAVGRWLTPGVFGARRQRPAMRPMRRMMDSTRERASA